MTLLTNTLADRPLVVPAVPQQPWKPHEKILFRVFAVYFFLQAVPLDWKFYNELLSVNWGDVHYGDIFNLAHYQPQFIEGQSYLNWLIILCISFSVAAAWTIVEGNKQKEYSVLFYWIRVVVRYRLAIGIIAYGMIKLFPVQAPYPSLSNLNTAYGEFNRWKLFSLSLGIVPSYQSFLGLVEVVLGLLLFYRKTATISAFLIVIFTGNVFFSNLAYEGGEQVYSFYLVTLALFLLVFDLHRIVNLLILQKPTVPNSFKPVFIAGWLRKARLPLKLSLFLFFFIFYGFKTATNYKTDNYQFSSTPGLKGYAGVYTVTEFKLNNQHLPYSKTDPARWQDVIFESWNTISIKSNREVLIDSNNTDKITRPGQQRNYEAEGTNGRHYYSYTIDSARNLLTLHNKNPHYRNENMVLHYQQGNKGIELSGTNQNNDSVYALLTRVNRKYLLEEAAKAGRRSRLKL